MEPEGRSPQSFECREADSLVHLENTRSEPGEEQIAEYDVATRLRLRDSEGRIGAVVSFPAGS